MGRAEAWRLMNTLCVFFERGGFAAMSDEKRTAYESVIAEYPLEPARIALGRLVRKWTESYVPPIGRICQEIDLVARDFEQKRRQSNDVRERQAYLAGPKKVDFRALLAKIGRPVRLPETSEVRRPQPLEPGSSLSDDQIEARRAELRRQAERLGVR